MIKCEEFREIVHDLLRDETLDPTVVEDAFVHTESCNACYALFGEAELLHVSLRSLGTSQASSQAPPRVQEALLTELARINSPLRSSRHQSINRWTRWAAGVLGAAAAAVLLLFLTGHRSAAPSHVASQSQNSPAALNGTYATNAVDAVDEEAATGVFVPLSESFDPSSLDDATVVRVVLSASALENLGLSFNGRDDDQVVADLVVANDGMPQAIRLVAW
jgi:hypothetical protein